MDDRESERERDGKDRTLFVRNFPWTTTDEELLQLFRTAGRVVSTRTVSFKKPPYRPRGIAFVVMATAEEASAALEKLNNAELGGREIMVQLAEPLPPKFGKKYTHRQYKSRAAAAGGAVDPPEFVHAARVSSFASWQQRSWSGAAVMPGRRSLLSGLLDVMPGRAFSSLPASRDAAQLAAVFLRVARRL